MAELFQIGISIFVEAVCVVLLLRRSRTPRLFILWILGMHMLTYPIFLFLCFGISSLPDTSYFVLLLKSAFGGMSGLAVAEGLIILLEGSLIYLMCRFLPSPTALFPVPSIRQCCVASFLGNLCSIIVSLILLATYSLMRY